VLQDWRSQHAAGIQKYLKSSGRLVISRFINNVAL